MDRTVSTTNVGVETNVDDINIRVYSLAGDLILDRNFSKFETVIDIKTEISRITSKKIIECSLLLDNNIIYNHIQLKDLNILDTSIIQLLYNNPRFIELYKKIKNNETFNYKNYKDIFSSLGYISSLISEFNGHLLNYATDELRNNRELVILAISKTASAITAASFELQSDITIWRLVLEKDPSCICYAPSFIMNQL